MRAGGGNLRFWVLLEREAHFNTAECHVVQYGIAKFLSDHHYFFQRWGAAIPLPLKEEVPTLDFRFSQFTAWYGIAKLI